MRQEAEFQPRLLADRPQPVLSPPRPAQRGQVVGRPEYGYELTVPSGWGVAAQHQLGGRGPSTARRAKPTISPGPTTAPTVPAARWHCAFVR